MKRFFYTFLPICLLTLGYNVSQAQTFKTDKDSVEVAVSGYVDMHDDITNLTNDTIRVTWKIFDHNLPQSWVDNAQFGLCDNTQCYPNTILIGTTQVSDTISANSKALFKAQFNVSSANVPPSTIPYHVTCQLVSGTTIDTVTFVISKFPTSITTTINTNNDIVLYPNPAQSELNIKFDKDQGVSYIAIYNLVGKQISQYKVSGNSAKLDIQNIPSGIYFIRLTDNTGQVVATRRFTHQ